MIGPALTILDCGEVAGSLSNPPPILHPYTPLLMPQNSSTLSEMRGFGGATMFGEGGTTRDHCVSAFGREAHSGLECATKLLGGGSPGPVESSAI